VVVLVGPGAAVRPAPAAVVAGLLSGAAFATHFVLAPRYMARLGSPAVFAGAMVAGAVVLAPAVRPQLPPVAALPPLAFVVLGSTVLASLCFGYAVTRLAPVRAAVLSTWEPVVATLLAWAVWGTPIGAGQVLGTAMVLASAALMSAGRADASVDETAGRGDAPSS
jgi:DME family drug/metabolite transporter